MFLLPSEVRANAQWRLKLRHAPVSARPAILQRCRNDVVFFVNSFGFTYDPRAVAGKRSLPFTCYPFQERVLADLTVSIRAPSDRLIEKTRDMGATWLIEYALLHQWLFSPQFSALMVSRKEDLVDKRGDPDSLFWKLDFALARLPGWMRPRALRNDMHLGNLDNGAVIDGEATVEGAGRGGRRTVIAIDEAAYVPALEVVMGATADASPTRWFVSTPNGMNAFGKLRQSGKVAVLTLHWREHPVKAAGLEIGVDGKPTSPWYRSECARRGSPREIAQELDIDYLASGAMFFDSPVLTRIKGGDIQEPLHAGELMGGKFEAGAGLRRLKLWLPLVDGRLPQDRNYVFGADVSFGQGASNAPISIADTKERRKVGEFISADLAPHELAQAMYNLARWVGGQTIPFLMWEANGPGLIVGKELTRLGYSYFYRQQREEALYAKRSPVPGWHSSRDAKILLLSDLRGALAKREFTIHSQRSLDELWTYVIYENGGVGPAGLSEDSEGARTAHGDIVIADALANRALLEQPKAVPPPETHKGTTYNDLVEANAARDRRKEDW